MSFPPIEQPSVQSCRLGNNLKAKEKEVVTAEDDEASSFSEDDGEEEVEPKTRQRSDVGR